MIKILLSVMIVSLSVPFVPLNGHGENIKTEPITVQVLAVENTENQIKQVVGTLENESLSIDFKIDKVTQEINQRMAEIESIEDKKEWFLAYKNIINDYSYILDPPETIYDYFTDEELDLLFRVVQAEIGDEYSFDQKVNVSGVIFGRLDHERFPNTISEILTSDQFQTISNGSYKNVEVAEDTILACEYAFQIGSDFNGCLFFDSNNTLKYEYVDNDGAHNFYKLREG